MSDAGATCKTNTPTTHTNFLVWVCRIAVGAVFIMSGLAKSVDLWGFVYKIEEYLSVWGLPGWRSLSFVAAMFISGFEFVCGVMLLTGSFRRSVVWWLLLTMAFMLPLTLYIWIVDPVSDCGCFGDFLVISNAATFFKNVAITVALVYLARNNRRVAYVYNPYIQWIPMLLCSVYIVVVGLIGYNVQPLVDFRSFPVGTSLVSTSADGEDDDVDLRFIYTKDGVEKEFTIDNLPDSTWEFVDQTSSEYDAKHATDFTVIVDGEDVAPELVAARGEQLMLLIPELQRADISYALLLNEINEGVEARGGSMFCLVGNGNEGVERWRDYSMSEYEVVAAEPTLIKEIARGNMALVGLRDGVVKWKRTVSSLSLDDNTGTPALSGFVGAVVMHGEKVLVIMSVLLGLVMLLIAFPGFVIRAAHAFRKAR